MNIVGFIKKYSIGKILCYIILVNFFTSYILINGNNITGMFIVVFSIVLIISSVILFSEMMATRVFTMFLAIFTISGSWRFSYLYRQNNYAIMAVFILFNYIYYGIVLGLSFQIINNSIKEFKNLNSRGLLLRGSVLAILCILGNIYYKQVVVFTGF